ncbi:hypothetical protein BJ742DRAFT_765711 [Cladochytrium replicatum]|nr:hypothetical protein BJ742DRAFT_765711 [Cladochytrium replicatum]
MAAMLVRQLGISLILVSLALGQTVTQTPGAATTPCSTSSNSTTGGCASTTTNPAVCDPKAVPGGFLFKSPTINTIAEVGSPLNISWSYTPYTKTNLFPNNSIEIFFQNAAADGFKPAVWTRYVATRISPNATFYIWDVPQIQNGQYILRLVADGFDPVVAAAKGQTVCWSDGQPIPQMSNEFRIVNPQPLAETPDNFGPNSGASSLRRSTAFQLFPIFVLIALAVNSIASLL